MLLRALTISTTLKIGLLNTILWCSLLGLFSIIKGTTAVFVKLIVWSRIYLENLSSSDTWPRGHSLLPFSFLFKSILLKQILTKINTQVFPWEHCATLFIGWRYTTVCIPKWLGVIQEQGECTISLMPIVRFAIGITGHEFWYPTRRSTHRPTHLPTCYQGIDNLAGGPRFISPGLIRRTCDPLPTYLLQVVSQESLPQLSKSQGWAGDFLTRPPLAW